MRREEGAFAGVVALIAVLELDRPARYVEQRPALDDEVPGVGLLRLDVGIAARAAEARLARAVAQSVRADACELGVGPGAIGGVGQLDLGGAADRLEAGLDHAVLRAVVARRIQGQPDVPVAAAGTLDVQKDIGPLATLGVAVGQIERGGARGGAHRQEQREQKGRQGDRFHWAISGAMVGPPESDSLYMAHCYREALGKAS